MRDKAEDIGSVLNVLRRFQEGYTRRDMQELDAFMELFAPDPGLEVIGTGALTPGVEEWCLGRAAVRDLVESDWLHWGDLRLDVDGARIDVLGDAAWLAAEGMVSQRYETETSYRGMLAYLGTLAAAEAKPAEERLLRALLGCANTLYELRRGEDFVWPLRFTAVLARDDDGAWRFRQMQFSFATTRYPDERVVG